MKSIYYEIFEDLRERINHAINMVHPCRLTVRVDRNGE